MLSGVGRLVFGQVGYNCSAAPAECFKMFKTFGRFGCGWLVVAPRKAVVLTFPTGPARHVPGVDAEAGRTLAVTVTLNMASRTLAELTTTTNDGQRTPFQPSSIGRLVFERKALLKGDMGKIRTRDLSDVSNLVGHTAPLALEDLEERESGGTLSK
ncbi:hypothetical protein Bbelb_073870 [Branchiostoma belcheri]|nr:hypothetical protein Bbelb_073870 [Branchiostoma belcheri]